MCLNSVTKNININDIRFVKVCMKILSIQSEKYYNEIRISKYLNWKDAMSKLNYNIYWPCLQCIDNMLTNNDGAITQTVLECDYLNSVRPFTYHWETAVRKVTMLSLANILRGNTNQIEYVISNSKILFQILQSANNDNKNFLIEAIICLCYGLMNGTPKQKKK
eukprot:321293_1